jgi:hypothetical protein
MREMRGEERGIAGLQFGGIVGGAFGHLWFRIAAEVNDLRLRFF